MKTYMGPAAFHVFTQILVTDFCYQMVPGCRFWKRKRTYESLNTGESMSSPPLSPHQPKAQNGDGVRTPRPTMIFFTNSSGQPSKIPILNASQLPHIN